MAGGKSTIIAVGALLLGFLGGSWTGGSKNRLLQDELDRTRNELSEARKKAQAAAPLTMGLQSLLQARRLEPTPAPVKLGVAGASDEAGGTSAPTPEVESTPRSGTTSPELGADDRKKSLQAIAATWRLRGTQARAAFVEAANLTPNQKSALEKTVDHLNQELKVTVDQALEKINFENPQRRDLVDLGVAIGNIYQDLDDELRQSLTDEQMTQMNESEFDIFTQVDPEVVMPLLQKIDNSH